MENLINSLTIGIILLLFLSSCKAYRNVENLKPKATEDVKSGSFDRSSLAKLVPGDQLIVTTLTGFTYRMIYTNYTGVGLVGSAWKVNDQKLDISQKTEIPFEEIDQVRVKRVSAAATITVVVISTTIIVVPIAYVLLDGIYIGF